MVEEEGAVMCVVGAVMGVEKGGGDGRGGGGDGVE